MGRNFNVVLSDDMISRRSEKPLQYSLTSSPGPINLVIWKAEIIGPFDSEFFGRSANAWGSDKAVERLTAQLQRNGFIGRLVPTPELSDPEALYQDAMDMLLDRVTEIMLPILPDEKGV